MPRRVRHLMPISPTASAEETAAIVAALERFMRATVPAAPSPADEPEGWRRAALIEGVEREFRADEPHPWINT